MTVAFQSFGRSALGDGFIESPLKARGYITAPAWLAGSNDATKILISSIAAGTSGWSKSSLSAVRPRYPWATYGRAFGFNYSSGFSDLYQSSDGLTWTKQITARMAFPQMFKSASSRLFLGYGGALAADGENIAHSDNNFTTPVTTALTANALRSTPFKQFAGGRIIFGLNVPSPTLYKSTIYYTDDDGDNWSSYTIDDTFAGWIQNMFYVSATDTMYLVCRHTNTGFATNYLYSSADGTSWTQVKALTSSDCSWNRTVSFYNRESYVLSSGRVIVSMDLQNALNLNMHYSDNNGQKWYLAASTGVDVPYGPLRKKDGILYARTTIDTRNKIIQSSDGVNWSELVNLYPIDTTNQFGLAISGQEDN